MYFPVPLETKEVAVQRLVLIVPVEEQVHDDAAPAGVMYMMKENDGDSQICVGTAQSLSAPFLPVSEKYFSVVVFAVRPLQCCHSPAWFHVCALAVNAFRTVSGPIRRSDGAHL